MQLCFTLSQFHFLLTTECKCQHTRLEQKPIFSSIPFQLTMLSCRYSAYTKKHIQTKPSCVFPAPSSQRLRNFLDILHLRSHLTDCFTLFWSRDHFLLGRNFRPFRVPVSIFSVSGQVRKQTEV